MNGIGAIGEISSISAAIMNMKFKKQNPTGIYGMKGLGFMPRCINKAGLKPVVARA